MSRRFGRNQKRRMRENIEMLERQIDNLNRSNESSIIKAQALQYVVDGVRDALGKHSVIFEPVLRMAFNYYIPKINLVPKSEMPDFSTLHTEPPKMQHLRYDTATVINCHVERDHIIRREHFYVSYDGKDQLGYAIDDYVLMNMDKREIGNYMHEHISRYMTHEFIKGYAKNQARGYA